jgi:hypothetical protein
MPKLGGTEGIKECVGEYDFAKDGGAIGTLVMRSDDGAIPNGSVVLGGYIEVDTPVTSGGAATIAGQIESAGDLQAAAAVSGAPWSTTGRKSIVPVFTGASSVKTTAERNLTIVIAAATLTAGKFRIVALYR